MAATKRAPRGSSTSDPVGEPPDIAVTPSAVGATGSNFEGFIWQQLGDIQKSLGTIVANQSTADDRLKSLEGKVSGLNRLVWIGIGIFGVLGVLIGIANPLINFLIRVGVVTVK